MKILTFSVSVGSSACNASCPFCISKTTYLDKGSPWKPDPRRFNKACRFAKINNVSTVMITSKGEPTLFPEQISWYLGILSSVKYDFPIIELQTNGSFFDNSSEHLSVKCDNKIQYVREWFINGLTTVCVSICHYDSVKNKEIYFPDSEHFVDIKKVISNLHNLGFTVRLCCTMINGYIDSVNEIQNLVEFAKENNVEQLKLTPVSSPNIFNSDKKNYASNKNVYDWITEKGLLSDNKTEEIRKFFDNKCTKLIRLNHESYIYDYDGQNICFKRCLTLDENYEEINSIIYFNDGHLRYDWQHKGAILF